MAFVRAKKQGKYTYYWLVENYRDGKKVRQKTIKYLGKEEPSPQAAGRIVSEFKGAKKQ